MYLKEVRRIQALLCLYFLASSVEALVQRELPQAIEREKIPVKSEKIKATRAARRLDC